MALIGLVISRCFRLLLAMGYDKGSVNKAYGPNLMDPPSRKRKFMIGRPNLHPLMIPADSNFGPLSQ